MGIQIRGLRKEYGHTVVLNHIDLDIDHGVFGLLGKNGAGKTTLMKVLATLTEPTSGEVWIDGVSIMEKRKSGKRSVIVHRSFPFIPMRPAGIS